MLATGHRCSVCSLRSVICSFGIFAPLAAKTRIVPDTCCNCEGTGGSISIGSCKAPRSSLIAVKENSNLSISSLLGFIWRPTKSAVACVHPMSAASKVSTGCGASSLPPMGLGRSVCIEWPVFVVTVTLPLLLGVVWPWIWYVLAWLFPSSSWYNVPYVCILPSRVEGHFRSSWIVLPTRRLQVDLGMTDRAIALILRRITNGKQRSSERFRLMVVLWWGSFEMKNVKYYCFIWFTVHTVKVSVGFAENESVRKLHSQ